jgi:hypothetical protein
MMIFCIINVYELPVFAPNDYFWKHHWKEGKEEKYAAYSRAVRQIMGKHYGAKLVD